MPSVLSGKARKPSFETSSIILGKRVCDWYWKEGSCQVARFSKYKYRCPVKFELEKNNEIYMCVKYVPCNIWNLLTFKKNGIVSLQWKFSWATHILSGNPNLEKQLGYPRHVAFIVFCVLGSEILILSNHW